MQLFNVSKFKEYEKSFTDFLFEFELQLTYRKYFDFMRVKIELDYMCSKSDFHSKSIHCIKKLIVKDELKDVLEESIRLN